MRRIIYLAGGLVGLLFCNVYSYAADRVAGNEQAPFKTTSNIYYGDATDYDKDLQSLDVYWQNTRRKLPVVIFVHGGGWAFGDKKDVGLKPEFFLSQGIAFVSMNYRLRWDYQIFDQAEDIVTVVKWVRDNAETYGMDGNKIILMGHAAGAHLVSLVGTNGNYMKLVGLSLGDLAGIVAIDTSSFDINRLMDELGSFIERRQHGLIFGKDEDVWRQSSPIFHVKKGSNIPGFAILYSVDDEQAKRQAGSFAKKLSDSNIDTIMIPGIGGAGHEVNNRIGSPNDTSTGALMAFIRAKT